LSLTFGSHSREELYSILGEELIQRKGVKGAIEGRTYLQIKSEKKKVKKGVRVGGRRDWGR